MNLEALCKEVNLELYDSELTSENGKKIYRVYVMKPLDEKGERRGANLDDCARLSEILSPIFDVEPPVSGEYFFFFTCCDFYKLIDTFCKMLYLAKFSLKSC